METIFNDIHTDCHYATHAFLYDIFRYDDERKLFKSGTGWCSNWEFVLGSSKCCFFWVTDGHHANHRPINRSEERKTSQKHGA